MLTDQKIKKHKPQGTREILWDTHGLGLRVGARKQAWVFRYTFEGRRALLTLGTYPAMSLEAARKEAAVARLSVEHGIDPGTAKKTAHRERKAAPVIEDAIEEFWGMELQGKKSGKETRRLLRVDVVQAWGRRKVADITRRDIVLLLDNVRGRAPITANRVNSALSRLFNFCCERGIIDSSPCTRIKKPKETPRSRVLTDEELKLVWAALDTDNKIVDIYAVTRLALKMVLFTGQRPGEVCGMQWNEIAEGFWTIPAERMKGGEAHRVPLTGMAIEVINQARTHSGDSPYVFKSPQKDSAPLTPAALSRAVLRHWEEEMGLKAAFTPHDLRRTFRTRLAELGVSDIIAERVLGHKLQGVLGIYNRHSYDLEKQLALEKWEAKLRLIVGLDKPETAKIIPIKG